MVNIVGPFGTGINETTERPTDVASGLSLDTWFKDCVPGVRGSGTIPTHIWLNKVTALLRRAIRGMGVSEDELDDDMLLKALLAAQLEFENVGYGTSVHHEFNVAANAHRIHSIKGVNIAVSVDPETGAIVLTGGVPQLPLAEIAPMLMIEEQRAGAAEPLRLPGGQTPVRRPLNTIIINQIEGAYLDNGLIILPAGTYRIKFAGVCYGSHNHHARLWNVTTGSMVARGWNADSWTDHNDDQANVSMGLTRATFASETVLELQHRSIGPATTQARMGSPKNVAPDYHLDAWIAITQETQP